ncbi:hypothetical protein ScPMuIL_005005 [Solemya velum]
MTEKPIDVPRLELTGVLGFKGSVAGGIKVHPDSQHIIYPLGCTVIVENIKTHKQHFLWGHTDEVSCLAVSNNGDYLASGQNTHMGFKADIIIWDFRKLELYCRLTLHKVRVEALAFSPSDCFLVSLGGQDDGSVVIWNVEKKEALCGHSAQTESAGNTCCVCFSNVSDTLFVTGGDGTLRIWELDVQNRKIHPTDVTMGQLKRQVKCIQMADDFEEKFFFAGTSTGDIIVINMKTKLFQYLGPEKNKFNSIRSLALVKNNGDLIIGAGDGTLAQARFTTYQDKHKKKAQFKCIKTWKDPMLKNRGSAITSIALRGEGHQFFIGTENSQMYCFNFAEFTCSMIKTCHSEPVNDVVFPSGTSQLILTCQKEQIRIWQMKTKMEVLRQEVANMQCNALDITRDGQTIVSAWDDGKIRAYGFSTAKKGSDKKLVEKFVIADAHKGGVTALAITSDGCCIVSGGGEGQVRVWQIQSNTNVPKLIENMKEHKGAVSAIKICRNETECASASHDGTCIIWDLRSKKRKQIVFSNTLFKCLVYGPNDCQIITSGTDRKIGYWETYDGQQIRDLEGAKSGSVNAMDVSPDWKYFVTGGDDKLLKVWTYNEGAVKYVGLGHSGSITRVKICPEQENIVSVSKDGAILIWKFPFKLEQQTCE